MSPNAFKGTLTAGAAARATARGAKLAWPGVRTRMLPIADGGDGLLDALRAAVGGKLLRTRVAGPNGVPVTARWLLAGRTAVIEMAEASGLRLLAGRRLRPLDASTRGVGQLIRAAAARGAREIVVGLGGSASNDGGAGCAEAFGFGLLDSSGRQVPAGARGLDRLNSVVSGKAGPAARRLTVVGLADVRNRLCGRLGSARVFGPQKGASPSEVKFMEKALLNYSRVLKRCLGSDVSALPGGAAAGGLGAGLAAFFGARLEDGSAFVLERVGFGPALAKADLLITGEGCFDGQTFFGKAPGAAIAAAREAGVPVVVACGRSLITDKTALRRLGVAGVIEAGRGQDPAKALELAVARQLPAVLAGSLNCLR